MIVLIALFLCLNIRVRGPFAEATDDNALAFHGKCQELSVGWPAAVYLIYPQGYVSPLELLPWDVAPRSSRWSLGGMLIDLLIAGVLAGGWVRLHGWRRQIVSEAGANEAFQSRATQGDDPAAIA
jgi:hypothetical protein